MGLRPEWALFCRVGVLGIVEVLMLCLGLADKRAASSLLPASTQAEDPGGEKAGPGLEERWCFISQIINYDDIFLLLSCPPHI